MKTRAEAIVLIMKQLDNDTPASTNKNYYHYGKQELKELMDFIYEGTPVYKDENIG